jgi:hypothetical protein
VTESRDVAMSEGEVELLIDGLSDDVSFAWALIHLGLRANPPAIDEPPSADVVKSAFESFERLRSDGLIAIGRTEYVDPSTPPGTVAPVRHVAEPTDVVIDRVSRACAAASESGDWAFSCWLVNTDAGDRVAQRALDERT